MSHRFYLCCTIFLFCMGTITVSGAQTFNAANGFSATNNPNGVWQYGYSNTLKGAFNLYTERTTYATMDAWNRPNMGFPDNYPLVWHNGTDTTVNFNGGSAAPNMLGLHPGPQSQYSIVQWTAPKTGAYDVVTVFEGLELSTQTDAHLLHNDLVLFDHTIIARGNPASYSRRLQITAGDTLRFMIGDGGNGMGGDTTALSARIQLVPSPGALLVAFIGAIPGSALLLKRHRK